MYIYIKHFNKLLFLQHYTLILVYFQAILKIKQRNVIIKYIYQSSIFNNYLSKNGCHVYVTCFHGNESVQTKYCSTMDSAMISIALIGWRNGLTEVSCGYLGTNYSCCQKGKSYLYKNKYKPIQK